MKRRDLVKHLREHGCVAVRVGGEHEVFENTRNGHRAPVPQHREVPGGLACAICRELSIPKP